MSSLSDALSTRLQKKEKEVNKMAHLAERSQGGSLSSFSGIFQVGDLSLQEKEHIEGILNAFCQEKARLSKDLEQLLFLTSEVKAITHQAVLLHGERIQKAQEIFQYYKEGAFSSWLIATYGNRQTPYNFLRYFEFWRFLNDRQKAQIEQMPRQAVYSLASREGHLQKKLEIVDAFSGETKAQLLRLIRDLFPLADKDRRKTSFASSFLNDLERVLKVTEKKSCSLSKGQKETARALISQLQEWIDS